MEEEERGVTIVTRQIFLTNFLQKICKESKETDGEKLASNNKTEREETVRIREEQLADFTFQSDNNKSNKSHNKSHTGVFTLLLPVCPNCVCGQKKNFHQ